MCCLNRGVHSEDSSLIDKLYIQSVSKDVDYVCKNAERTADKDL